MEVRQQILPDRLPPSWSIAEAVIKATHPLLPWKLNPFRRMLSLAGLIPPGLVYFHHYRVDSGHKSPRAHLLSSQLALVP